MRNYKTQVTYFSSPKVQILKCYDLIGRPFKIINRTTHASHIFGEGDWTEALAFARSIDPKARVW